MGTTMDKSVSAEMLAEFAAAWNRHDIDALMSFMSEDCVFLTVAGPEQWGARHEGPDAVRRLRGGLAELSGRAVAQRPALGLRRAWRVGIDLHRHGGGRLARRGRHGGRVHLQERQDPGQNAYRKQRPALPARA